DELTQRGVRPTETAADLTVLAALVTAADTRISRAVDAQDGWTREIDLYLPVLEPDRWLAAAPLIERMLKFLTGDRWRLTFRARVGFDQNDFSRDMDTESSTRGRSFLFFALAALAASGIPGRTTFYVPENGLISLNVPLDILRVGACSTRTTHPFYMARWQDLF